MDGESGWLGTLAGLRLPIRKEMDRRTDAQWLAFMSSRIRRRKNGCWEWTGKRNRWGYGRIKIAGRNRPAHTILWELFNGPFPAGLEPDHLCRNPSCVNPDHLEPVTHKENTARGDAPTAILARLGQCKKGHSLESAYIRKEGWRMCRTCHRDTERVRRGGLKGQARKLNRELVAQMMELRKQGVSQERVARQFNVTQRIVSAIERGQVKIWSDFAWRT